MAEGIDKTKNSILARTQRHERFKTGRLYAHHKHVEMKEYLRDLRRKEGTLREDQE